MNKNKRFFKAILSNDIQKVNEMLKPSFLNILKRVNVNIVNKFGDTPLIIASGRGLLKMADLLIANGANVNHRNDLGNTPLHSASYNGFIEIAEMLISRGADVNAKNNEGETPLLLASRLGYTEIAKLLIKNGADVSLNNNDGITPLKLASVGGFEELVNLLKGAGAIMPETERRGREGKMSKKTTKITKGGFGEPYCSEECYEAGGKYIAAVMIKNQTGVCGFCQKPVQANMYGISNCAIIPYEGVNLFICNSCTIAGQAYLSKYLKCCMCQKKILNLNGDLQQI